MPAFPDRESSLLNKLYETAPWTAKLHGQEQAGSTVNETNVSGSADVPPVELITNGIVESTVNIGLPVGSTSKWHCVSMYILQCSFHFFFL